MLAGWVTLCVSNCCVSLYHSVPTLVEGAGVTWPPWRGQLRGTGDRGWLQEPCYQVMPQLWNYRCRTFVGLCIYSIEIPSFLKINHWPECSNVLTFNYNSVCQVALVVSDSMDCSPPGFSVLGILQTSILEWVAMPSSRGFS